MTAKRAGRRDFAEIVRTAPASPVTLPLTHVTDAYAFRDIMASEALGPAHCDVFDDNLVYLFYGRPAYRAMLARESNAIDAYWPICFVMKPHVAAAKRIYPFDSGAFERRLFAGLMHHGMIKEDFELDPDPETPGKLLRLFWRDEKAYFNAAGASDFVPESYQFEAKAYRSLLADSGQGPYDDRCSAIELQVAEAIPLDGNTLAVILPVEFATSAITARIEAMGAVALPFDVTRRQRPAEMIGLICNIVRDLLGGTSGGGRAQCW